MNIIRHPANPILKIGDVEPSQPCFEVIGVFNAGAISFQGKKILLVRVAEKPIVQEKQNIPVPIFDRSSGEVRVKLLERSNAEYDFSDPRVIRSKSRQNYLTSISHIRLAESEDGVHFTVASHPLIQAFDEYSAFGVEDARVTCLGDVYTVNFSAASELGIITRLFTTTDFVRFTDLGNIFHPDNKDVAIFPEKINGLYYAFHRPSTSEYGQPNLWIASSPDLIHWGDHQMVAAVRPGRWDSGRMGASCVPLKTPKGWLEIYHGATLENRYCLGAMLLDLNEPWKVLARSETPLLEPAAPYETDGFFGNVIFSCGLIQTGDKLDIYYGASDDSVCLAQTAVSEVLNFLKG